MLDLLVRGRVAGLLDPVGRGLGRLGLSPTVLTVGGLAVTVGGAAVVAGGRLLLGSLVILAGAALDLLDGAVARATGSMTPRGGLLDSASDRLGETAMWVGLAYHLAGQPWAVALCALALGTSFLISYLRSKADAAGVDGRGGWMGRPERVVLYVLGLATGLVGPMLWAMTVLTILTAGQRFRIIWRRLPV